MESLDDVRGRPNVRSAAVVGIGETEFSPSSGRSSTRLALEASLLALQDAGLRAADLDGVVVPSPVSATVEDLMTHLGITDLSFVANLAMGGAGPVGALHHARLAVAMGVADNVLVAFGNNGRSGARLGRRTPVVMRGDAPSLRRNFDGVHGLVTPAQFYALWAQRYMHDHGWRDTLPLAEVARVQSRYGLMNANALVKQEISHDDHQASRMISSPFRMYDCSREADGGVAFVISAATRHDRPVAVIRGAAESHPPHPDQATTRPEFLRTGMRAAADRAFAMAGWERSDIACAELYDAFTFSVVWQLEELGLCAPGKSRDFVLSGETGPAGTLPVNTHGGLLSQAHLWGMNHVTEAVRQLRGTAGEAQVPRVSRVLVTGFGDFGDASVALLERSTGELVT